MSLPILMEVDYVLNIWLGNNIPEYTAAFIIIIVLNSFLNNLNAAISGLVHATGKMRTYQLCGGTISLVSVVIVYIAMLIWRTPTFALIVLLIMDAVREIVALFILKSIVKDFSLKTYVYKVAIPLLLVGIMAIIPAICIHHYMPGSLLRFCIVSAVSIATTCGCIYYAGLDKSEKRMVKQITGKLFSKLSKKTI